MRGKQVAALIVVLAVGFTFGTVAGAAILIGPLGYKPPFVSVAQPAPTSTFAPASPSPSPLARVDAGMGFDAATGEMILFGGWASSGCDLAYGGQVGTWAWNGKVWRRVDFSLQPSGRSDPAMAYDPVHRNVVMRGGLGDDGYLEETWIWNGTRWLLQSPDQSPPTWRSPIPNGGYWNPPADQPLFWDAQRQQVGLFAYTRYRGGGYNIPELNEIWAWDGSTWVRRPTAGSPPAGYASSESAVAYVPSDHTLVLFGFVNNGPTTWTFDGTTWGATSPISGGPTAQDFAMASDDARSSVVMYTASGTTWTWNGMKWTAQNPLHTPPPRVGEAMAYDSSRHEVVLFGGIAQVGNHCTVLGDTWTWNGTDWTEVG